MSTHNIGFYEDLTKIIFQLSSNTHLISSSAYVPYREKTCLTRSDTNRSVQPQKMARGLKFRI